MTDLHTQMELIAQQLTVYGNQHRMQAHGADKDHHRVTARAYHLSAQFVRMGAGVSHYMRPLELVPPHPLELRMRLALRIIDDAQTVLGSGDASKWLWENVTAELDKLRRVLTAGAGAEPQ